MYSQIYLLPPFSSEKMSTDIHTQKKTKLSKSMMLEREGKNSQSPYSISFALRLVRVWFSIPLFCVLSLPYVYVYGYTPYISSSP